MTTPVRPDAHHSVNPFVMVTDASAFIAFVTEVFQARETTAVRTADRDGSLIHAEVVIGDSTVMLCDKKPGWPLTPAFLQVYVDSAEQVLDRAVAAGATLVTPRSDFYGGFDLARFRDPWRNLWWLYAPASRPAPETGERASSTEWHAKDPSIVYTTLMAAMENLTR